MWCDIADLHVMLNITARDEHVPEIERLITGQSRKGFVAITTCSHTNISHRSLSSTWYIMQTSGGTCASSRVAFPILKALLSSFSIRNCTGTSPSNFIRTAHVCSVCKGLCSSLHARAAHEQTITQILAHRINISSGNGNARTSTLWVFVSPTSEK